MKSLFPCHCINPVYWSNSLDPAVQKRFVIILQKYSHTAISLISIWIPSKKHMFFVLLVVQCLMSGRSELFCCAVSQRLWTLIILFITFHFCFNTLCFHTSYTPSLPYTYFSIANWVTQICHFGPSRTIIVVYSVYLNDSQKWFSHFFIRWTPKWQVGIGPALHLILIILTLADFFMVLIMFSILFCSIGHQAPLSKVSVPFHCFLSCFHLFVFAPISPGYLQPSCRTIEQDSRAAKTLWNGLLNVVLCSSKYFLSKYFDILKEASFYYFREMVILENIFWKETICPCKHD